MDLFNELFGQIIFIEIGTFMFQFLMNQVSAATNCPITVFTDGYLLTLKNASPDRDMTIRITDMAKGGVVYENDIPEVQSAYITISIANFPAEEYKLEITGTPSGHLT